MLVADPGDLRAYPRRKGPGPAAAARAARAGRRRGRGRARLCDADGRLLEGALHSLLWWEDDTLCTTPDERTLPSITRWAAARARRRSWRGGAPALPLPEELADCEAWLANAVHGICPIVAWEPDGPRAGSPDRAFEWRALLDETARHLDG